MNFLFLMDPLETVKVDKDTSFAFMLAAHARGHRVTFCPTGGIALKNNDIVFHALDVVPQRDSQVPFIKKEEGLLSSEQVDAVFIRTDPPFDASYLMNTWLLDRLPARISIINRPAGIRTANEKIWASQFTDLIPETVITRHRNDFLDFFNKHGEVILKPVNGFGGQSVFYLRPGDSNAWVAFETLCMQGTQEVVLQPFLPEAREGDKRILLLNGEILGAVLRLHGESDHRNNFMAGGKPVACEISDRDIEIIDRLRPKLQELGLYFVGLDIIGEHLIEVNVTSPTCLQEMERIYGSPLADKVISFTENLMPGT